MSSKSPPFRLAAAEASRIQALLLARQASFARRGVRLKLVSIAIPIVAIASLVALDWLGFDGQMPGWFFAALVTSYLLGTFSQMLAMWVSVTDTRRRMLEGTPQVWEERTIELRDEGVVQAMETSRMLSHWSSVSSVERKPDILMFWLTNFSAVALPLRVFDSAAEADAFEAEARRLTGGAGPGAAANR